MSFNVLEVQGRRRCHFDVTEHQSIATLETHSTLAARIFLFRIRTISVIRDSTTGRDP